MTNAQLYILLQDLTNKEIRSIRSMLAAPYFNNRAEVSQLFELLIHSIQSKELPKKENIYLKIVGKTKAYDDQKIRLWMSYLLKLIEKQLILESVLEDDTKTNIRLAKLYRERNLNSHHERKIRELEKKRTKQEVKNAEYFRDEFHIQQEKYRFSISKRRMSELNIQALSDNLDITFIAQKLRQSCLALSHQAVYKTDYNFGLLPEILHYVEQEQLYSIPAIGLYYYGYKTLSSPEEDAPFKAFKQAILEYGNQFPKEELGDLFILAINFCIKRNNAGDHRYHQDEFEIYRRGLQQGIFIRNNILSRFSYRNIVTTALVLQEYDWAETFIHTYKPYLDQEFRESTYSFSLARLEYSRKNFEEALQLLQKAEYKDLLLNLAAKTVMLKIFFELDEFDLLSAHLDAMRNFIRRKKIMGYHKTHYSNLVHFTKKLTEVNPFEKPFGESLKKEIMNTPEVAEKAWLIQQLK